MNDLADRTARLLGERGLAHRFVNGSDSDRAVLLRQIHPHSWFRCAVVDGVEAQDCACGERRFVQKNRDGSEAILDYHPAATSAENALIFKEG